mgnify:CR=1 FL=1
MKNILLIVLFCFFVISCSKDGSEINTSIVGEWSWIKSSGGLAGITYTPENTGEIRKLVISSDSMKYFSNDNLIMKLEYKIKTVDMHNESREMIIRESDDTFRQFFEINQDELILTDYCDDCFVNEYKRSK